MDGSLREVRPRQPALPGSSAPDTRGCSSVVIFSFEHIGQMSSSWDTMVAEDFDPFKVPFMLGVSLVRAVRFVFGVRLVPPSVAISTNLSYSSS